MASTRLPFSSRLIEPSGLYSHTTDGPPPIDWMYAPIASICFASNFAGLRTICDELIVAGMRPECTWKYTAASPTPIRRRTAVLDALEVGAVTGDARRLVQVLALRDLGRRVTVGYRDLRGGAHDGGDAAGREQATHQQGCAGDLAAELAVPAILARLGDGRAPGTVGLASLARGLKLAELICYPFVMAT